MANGCPDALEAEAKKLDWGKLEVNAVLGVKVFDCEPFATFVFD